MSHQYPRPRSRNVQSRVTNGKALLTGIDGRSKWARRLHDLVANHVDELGGPNEVTQSQFLLIKSAANLTIAMEQLELEFAKEGAANFAAMIGYQTLLNSLRRVFETLGVERKAAATKAEVLDLTNLTAEEQKRVRLLANEYAEVGGSALGLTKLLELQRLTAKARGYGYGPSTSDPTQKTRPYHEIDWT